MTCGSLGLIFTWSRRRAVATLSATSSAGCKHSKRTLGLILPGTLHNIAEGWWHGALVSLARPINNGSHNVKTLARAVNAAQVLLLENCFLPYSLCLALFPRAVRVFRKSVDLCSVDLLQPYVKDASLSERAEAEGQPAFGGVPADRHRGGPSLLPEEDPIHTDPRSI